MGCFDYLWPLALGDAEIHVLSSADAGRVVRVRFIVKTFKLAKENEYLGVSVPGLSGEPLQFVRGRARTLSASLLFDGRATDTDVRDLMRPVTTLMKVDTSAHAPPVLRFTWRHISLKCVLVSVVEEFSSVFSDGRPSRGRIRATFRESLTIEELTEDASRQ